MNMNRRFISTASDVFVSCLIILWIYTGLNKAIDFENMKLQLGRSPFISSYATIIAYTLPIAELITALLLVIRKTRLIGLYLSLFLMTSFTEYVYFMLKYSYDLPCSCGGVLEKLSWEDHLIFNFIFTVICLAAIIIDNYLPKTLVQRISSKRPGMY